jgi:putative ABC transport system permease protein
LYQLDAPSGTIRWEQAQHVLADPAVKKAIPVLLADNYWGFRIVGTSHDYVAHYGAALREGRLWLAPGEAVLGADVAARMHSTLGATFVAAHGVGADRDLLHQEEPYRVVGVLARTGAVVDRLVLTDVASVSRIHVDRHAPDEAELVAEPPPEDSRELTALLIQAATPAAAATLAKGVNAGSEMQAALPEIEIDRLFRIIGVGADVLWGFALVLMLSAGLSVFIALYHALSEHRQDLAIMRALGASPAKLMALLLVEGLILAAVGAALGLLLGHALTGMLGMALTRTHQVSVTGWIWSENEVFVIVLALGVGFVAALFPAWRARRIDIAATLARG